MFDRETIVGVCGAGAMGAGIAQVAAQAGHEVVVLDRDEAALEKGRQTVAKGAAALIKRGKIDAAEGKALEGRITWTLGVDALEGAGLVVEAIVEDPAAKQALFSDLEKTLGAQAVLATNTSSLSVTALASGLARPTRFLGLHFFNPAPIMKLVEVVPGLDSDAEIVRAAVSLMGSWGKVAVEARDVPGFIVNRVARPFYSEGWRALEEGAADAATLDFLYRDLAGFRMGPFELGDLIGHDINTAAAKSVYDAYYGRTRFTPSLMQEQLVAAGRLGRKSGRGVYDHGEAATKPAPSFVAGDGADDSKITVAADAPRIGAVLDGLGVSHEIDETLPADFAAIGGVLFSETRGEPALSHQTAFEAPVFLFDWMRDPASASALAFAASGDEARTAALAFAGRVGKRAVELTDRPGLVVFRTLAQLANCAADAVRDRVGDATSIDRAMMNGVNYPFGPMAWAEKTGFVDVAEALDSIAEETGEALYKPSESLVGMARRML